MALPTNETVAEMAGSLHICIVAIDALVKEDGMLAATPEAIGEVTAARHLARRALELYNADLDRPTFQPEVPVQVVGLLRWPL